MSHTHTTKQASAVLWASAFVLAALLITQLGKLPGNRRTTPARASTSNDFTLAHRQIPVSGEDAAPDELLYVIDSRDEILLVYEIEDARKEQIILRGGGSLRNLFTNASR